MDMPDIDTDVGDRDKLLELMRTKFGKENIVPISNYNTLQLRSLIKDVKENPAKYMKAYFQGRK